MRAVFPQAKDIQKLIAAATAFLSEGTFVSNKDGIRMTALDPANVAVISITMFPNMFTDYEVEDEVKFTVNLEDLKKILASAKAKDIVEFQVDEEKNKFIVSLKGKSRRTFSLPLIEGSEEGSIDIENLRSNLDLKVKAELDSKSFGEIIKAAKIVSDEIKLVSDPDQNKIIISAEGELKDMKVELSPNDENVLSIEVPSKAIARYSTDYLHKLTRIVQVTDILSLSYDTAKPLWIDYKSTEKFVYSFVLAPRE